MINKERLQEVLATYKQNFVGQWWDGEKYKWEAIKGFQDNWDINAPDFADMLDRSLKKTRNLLDSGQYFARKMIIEIAQTSPEKVRALFVDLFDENKDVIERIMAFNQQVSVVFQEQKKAAYKNHYQDVRAITTYLWLRYPDKYYVYKSTVAKAAVEGLDSNLIIKGRNKEDNLRKFLRLYDEVNEAIKEDEELKKLLQDSITPECYPDPELRTLTVDLGYYISKLPTKEDESEEEVKEQSDALDEVACAEAAEEIKTSSPYTAQDFLSDVYMTEEKYKYIVDVLKKKKNIILQGAPGVGKTYAAIRLAWSMMGEKDDERIKFVQFHQNYSYEDFVMGYKPENDGFKLKAGIFKRFSEKAQQNPDRDYFFIIDEINRGNMSKIFGELLMAIESDHRGEAVTLAYDGSEFSVPKNLYIIGMMNTADRSIAMIDYALRRRFAFVEMEPGFDSEGFIGKKPTHEKFDLLISKIKDLNVKIALDKSLGRGFCIGHSYFCNLPTDDIENRLREIVDYEIIPMLNEYWFDEPSEVQVWADALHNALK